MRNEKKYKEALIWLAGRMAWGISEPVAHAYQESIAMLVFGNAEDWDEALLHPCEDEYPFTEEQREKAFKKLDKHLESWMK